MRLKIKKQLWRGPSNLPSKQRKVSVIARRATAAFFVLLMLFTASELTGYSLLDYRAKQKALQSAEVIPGKEGKEGVALNPDYKDPRVKPTPLPLQEAADAKAENESKQDMQGPRTSAVTEAAKRTAVTKDPVQEYLKEQEKNGNQPKVFTDKEDKSKRTEHSYTYQNEQGGLTERLYTQPVNYKKNGAWQPIDGDLKDDSKYNQKVGYKASVLDQFVAEQVKPKRGFRQDDGLLKLGFRPLQDKEGSVDLKSDKAQSQLKISPIGSENTSPSLRTAKDGTEYVEYKDAWKDTDVFYEQRGSALKEFISLKSANTPTEFAFKVEGATLAFGKGKDGKPNGTVIATQTDGTEVLMPALTVASTKTGPISNPKLHYKLDGNVVKVVVDKAWLKQQPTASFPLVIDPTYAYYTYYHTGVPGGDLGHFIPYKSDGYVCNSTNCDIYVGSLNDYGHKSWRTMIHLPFTDVYGKNVTGASIYTERVNRPYTWSGFEGNREYKATWANCFGYNCRSSAPHAVGHIDWGGYLNATSLMQWLSTNNVGDGWLTMWGNEGDIQSFKAFSGANTYLDVQYYHETANRRTAIPTLNSPAKDAVLNVNRPTLKLNPVTDPDGDLVRYTFHLMDSRGNVVAYAGERDVPEWIIPDSVLVDGEKYMWKGWVMERNASNPSVIESGWRQTDETRTFTYDMRTGKDKTQTFEDVGTVAVNLNTGNMTTGVSSHTIGALGGNIGIGLEYNTPGLAKRGLMASYYNNTTASGTPAITVLDPNIDMNLGTSSPYPGVVQADNFSVTWTGHFVAPEAGTYTFGASRDDKIKVLIGGVTRIDATTCCGVTWSTQQHTMSKGTTYPISVTMTELTGAAQARLLVRGPNGTEQVVPNEWLVAQVPQNVTGLDARFYKNKDPNGNPLFTINDKTPLVLATNVPTVNANWGTNSLVPADPSGEYKDNVIVSYSGYVTIPTTGDYKFGGSSDDGYKVKLGGKQVYSHAGGTGFSAAMHFEAGQVIPIQIDYYEAGGAASVSLQWQGPAGNGVIPGQYLSPTPRVLPNGWNLSIDPDDNIPYESLEIKSNGDVELQDATGFTHRYVWNGVAKSYKPPVNEDGFLVRNEDLTFTLTDTDGRVYNFSSEGVITSITSPMDDRKPSGLQYEYRNTSTSAYTALPKLHKIIDSVDPSRYGQLYYWGEQGADEVCTLLTGAVAPPPGSLCAFKTFPNGEVTKLGYTNNTTMGNAIQYIEKPGNAKMTFNVFKGRYFEIHDIRENDAFAAGVTGNDSGDITITYDIFSRVTAVHRGLPKGTNFIGPDMQPTVPNNYGHTVYITYGFQATEVKSKADRTLIEYDNLLRTTKACDIADLCSSTEWDPVKDMVRSTTDAVGLKSTTIYDEDDRPVSQYGPAPAAWYGADNKPLATQAPNVPRTDTKYDEGITGPAVAWYGARGQSLFGAPKLHTTGIDTSDVTHIGRDFRPTGAVPIATDAVTPGYGFSATGKIKFPQAGLYTFRLAHDDGARLYINDNAVVDNWKTRTSGAAQNASEGTFLAEAGKMYRFRVDYIHFDDGAGAGVMDAWLRGPGISDISGSGWGTNKFGTFVNPSYGLTTTTTAFDKDVGDTITRTTYQNPAYGLLSGTVIDPAGLNYTSIATHETPGAGYMRQLSKTLPGGNQTKYEYYGATQAIDNPCTALPDPTSQAGQMRLRIDPDPDGSGSQSSRTVESVYDSAGRQVAMRVNDDPWTCTEYDVRGRIAKVTTPAKMNGSTVVRPGKTITNNYAYGGNPLVVTSEDETGAFVLEERDLYDRIVRTIDANGHTTTFEHDRNGRLYVKRSILGVEEIGYDLFNRPTTYKLNGVTYASITYDAIGRIQNVQYPESKDTAGNALKLEQIKYDSLLRDSGVVFKFSDNTSYEESVQSSVGGVVMSQTSNLRGTQATNSYQYDKAGRLTQATVDNMKYVYDFAAPTASTCNQSSANLNAHKNANRTAYAATNQTTNQTVATATYCYDHADRLIKSSDVQVGTPTYDDHGNMTKLAGNGTPITFSYNNLDQNIAIEQGENKVEYVRDANDTILRKKEYKNGVLAKSYRYAASGRVLQSCSLTDDNNCTAVDTYLALPGNVSLTLSPNNTEEAKKVAYSLKNFRGDTALTVGANGLPSSSVFLYEPFGQASQSQTFGTSSNPANSSNEGMGWAANPMRKASALFSIPIVQMGARVYLPSLGRFAQIDPAEGGNANPYVYPPDPINSNDYTGKFAWFAAIVIARVIIVMAPRIIAAVRAVATAVRVAATAARAVGPAVINAGRSIVGAVVRSGGGGGAVAGGGGGAISTKVARSANGVSAAGAKASSPVGRTHPGYQGHNGASAAFKSSPQLGRDAHNVFSSAINNVGGTANKAVFSGSKIRPDGYFGGQNLTLELKPGNLRGVTQGEAQLRKYMELSGGRGELWLYNVKPDGTFNYWLHGVY